MIPPATTLTPRKRVERALRGQRTDRVPFTMYESKIPQCATERNLRNRGLCIVQRRSVYTRHHPNVKVHSETRPAEGRSLTRTFYETPAGTLTTLTEAAGFTTWVHERMFKTPDDYKALRFLVRDLVFMPDYEAFARAEADFGEDAIFRAGMELEPLQALISGHYMGMETFCMEWMDNRDEILTLYHALVENQRRIYPIVAQSPAGHVNYGGNVTPEIIGRETFDTYYVPHYNEAADILHRHGKLVGCHFDANCGLIARAINETNLDYIEAFTPAPDTDLTLAQARAVWPDKILWINFPSSLHLKSNADVRRMTLDLVDQAGRTEGLLMGITEDIPPHRWQESCTAIMDGLDDHARIHPERYAI